MATITIQERQAQRLSARWTFYRSIIEIIASNDYESDFERNNKIVAKYVEITVFFGQENDDHGFFSVHDLRNLLYTLGTDRALLDEVLRMQGKDFIFKMSNGKILHF